MLRNAVPKLYGDKYAITVYVEQNKEKFLSLLDVPDDCEEPDRCKFVTWDVAMCHDTWLSPLERGKSPRYLHCAFPRRHRGLNYESQTVYEFRYKFIPEQYPGNSPFVFKDQEIDALVLTDGEGKKLDVLFDQEFAERL